MTVRESTQDEIFNIFYLVFFLDTGEPEQGPTKQELLNLLKNCDLAGASCSNSIASSRTPSPSPSLLSIMYPGFKLTNNIVSRIGTPISTPIMQHTTAAATSNNTLQTPYCSQLNDSSGVRLSGLFTGSNLSLNATTMPPEVPTHDMVSSPAHHHNHIESVREQEVGLDALSQDDSKTETGSLNRYSSKSAKVPDRPMSSSEVLDASSNHDSEPYLLRRVCSDTTPPISNKLGKSRQTAVARHKGDVNEDGLRCFDGKQSPLEPREPSNQELGSPVQSLETRESTLI